MSDFVDNSEKFRRELQQRLAGGLNAANKFLIDEARQDAPVGKSGELRDGIEVIAEANENNLVAAGAAKAPHSRIVNRGTSKTQAKPFWTTSWLRMVDGFGRFFKQ
jgi:HK97 gp10 family phage protein